jgi:hypothetical protein
MPQEVKVISARRGFEFRADDIRLTMLSAEPVVQAIQAAFRFQTVSLGTPQATFGPVTATVPPGVIFQSGVWTTEDKQIVPVRFIHCEPRRIVIDIPGPTKHISGIYSTLIDVTRQMQAPDGTQLIGEPEQISDHSEVTAKFDAGLDAWLPPSLREVFRGALGLNEEGDDLAMIPTFTVQTGSFQEEYPGSVVAFNARFLQFALRAGAKPGDHVYFSAAPLDTEAHLNYLAALERVLPSINASIR